MLQRMTHPFDLPCFRRPAKLVGQFKALRQARCAKRMALAQQSARGIGHNPPAIGIIAIGNEPGCAALFAQAKPFVGDQFIVSEAIVQLDHANIAWPHARGFIDGV